MLLKNHVLFGGERDIYCETISSISYGKKSTISYDVEIVTQRWNLLRLESIKLSTTYSLEFYLDSCCLELFLTADSLLQINSFL